MVDWLHPTWAAIAFSLICWVRRANITSSIGEGIACQRLQTDIPWFYVMFYIIAHFNNDYSEVLEWHLLIN